MRHFAEKQRITYKDSNVLFETTQFVPESFQQPLIDALDQALAATAPLRMTLKRQIETGRILPTFKHSDLVNALELYTYLTGNPFVLKTEKNERQRWVDRYQQKFDASIFDDLRAQQMAGIKRRRQLELAVYVYFRRLQGIAFRTAMGIDIPIQARAEPTGPIFTLKSMK
jgi:hypothetical protein